MNARQDKAKTIKYFKERSKDEVAELLWLDFLGMIKEEMKNDD